MKSLIEEMIGKKISIYTLQGGGERQDVGTLEAFDGTFAKVRKSDSEVLYFGVHQIRLIKNFL